MIVMDNRGTGTLRRDQLPAPPGRQGRLLARGRPLRAQARRRGERLRHRRGRRRPRGGARQARRAGGERLRRLVRHLLRPDVRGPAPRARARGGARRRLPGGGLRPVGARGVGRAALRVARGVRALGRLRAGRARRARAGGRCGSTPIRWWPRAATRTAGATRSGSTAPRSARWPATARTTTRSTATCWPPCARTSAATATPLLRLAAEDLPFTGGGPVKSYSEGAYAAVACHDYPTIWDPAAPVAGAPRAVRAPRARALAPDTYAPFPNDIWLRSLYIDQLVTGCLRWPAPRYPDPPVPPGATLPGRAGARARRRPGRDHAARRLRGGGGAVPELDARDGPERRPRDGARGLPRAAPRDRAALPQDAAPRAT